jgi:uncharacterized protein (TIGR00369 family)
MNAPHPTFQPRDPGYADRVRESFARQNAMRHIGARVRAVGPGGTEVERPQRDELTQQKGFQHGGLIGMIADNASGYAAYSQMPATASPLTGEYKINILAPGRGHSYVAEGVVLRSGRTLSVTRAEVFAETASGRVHVASMQQTVLMLADTADTPDEAE